MRLSINGLMAIIRDIYQMDPYANTLYLFCGRKTDRLKALYHDKNGFVLLYMRLDSGLVPISIALYEKKNYYPKKEHEKSPQTLKTGLGSVY